MNTIEERQASAAARWTRAVTWVGFARIRIADSRWLLTSSRALLDRPRPPFRGGGEAPFDELAVRERLRLLVTSGVLPHFHSGRVWVGPCRLDHACTVCSMKIFLGEIEVEMTSPTGVVIFLHRRCFDFWTSQPMKADNGQGQPRPSASEN